MSIDSFPQTLKAHVSLKAILLSCSLLCALTIIAYVNVFTCNFINYDDPLYLLDRPEVASGLTADSVRWAFTTTVEGNWIPLTWLSYLLDVSLFGINARAHHTINLLIHLINTLLLLFALRRLTGCYWRSAVVAALFALHPLHVESVAWIAERKDVLSGFFFMLSLLAYHSYVVSPSIRRYLTLVVVFALGLSSKSMLVTLPFLLLLLDYWPLGRLSGNFEFRADSGGKNRAKSAEQTFNPGSEQVCSGTADRIALLPVRHLIAEKIPLLLLALFSMSVTFSAQKQTGALINQAQSPLTDNIANALVSYVMYGYMTVVPTGLAVVYPFSANVPFWQSLLSFLLLAAVTVLVLRTRCRLPYLAIGWFWFLGMLVPVIGIIRIGSQAMADRYTYLPLTGLFIIAVWGSADYAAYRKLGQKYLIAATTVIIGVYAVLTWVQVGYWKNSIVLFTHAAAVREDNWLAYEKLASAFNEKGDLPQALFYAGESMRLFPRNPEIYVISSLIYNRLNQRDRAIVSCIKAIELDPGHEMAHLFLGRNLLFSGDMDGAIREYFILKEMNPVRADSLLKDIAEVRQMQR